MRRVTYFATITPTRHGWEAHFSQRGQEFGPSKLFPNGGRTPDYDVIGPQCWRHTRAGIERAAARVIRRLEADDQRHADSYEYTGDARRIADAAETDPEKIAQFKECFPTARTYSIPDAD